MGPNPGSIQMHGFVQDLTANTYTGKAYAPVTIQVITGNTTMLYLWDGRNPLTLSRAPFEADWLAGGWAADGKTYLPRCIGAFLGADIVCAVLASRMTTHDETVLLIDIGTNGEIALWHQGRLYCCATAAGPRG